MDKVQKLGVLTYDFNDYKYKEYLFIDNETGNVYRSTEDIDSENFSGVSFTNLNTNIRDYFEETITPLRMVELPNKKNRQSYHVVLHSETLNKDLQWELEIEKYENKLYKSVYYNFETPMEFK